MVEDKDNERGNLKNMSPEAQKAYMEEWFYGNYEAPVLRCPYDEGEYVYLWGGPYDAYEELEGQFTGEVADELIRELADELSSECWDWSSKEKPEDYSDFIEPNPEYYDSFIENINQIKDVVKVQFDSKVKDYLLKLLYVNAITVLETYLSEAFITLIFSNDHFVRKFVESNNDFRTRKISLSDLYKEHDKIHSTIQAYLSNLIWHNLKSYCGRWVQSGLSNNFWKPA